MSDCNGPGEIAAKSVISPLKHCLLAAMRGDEVFDLRIFWGFEGISFFIPPWVAGFLRFKFRKHLCVEGAVELHNISLVVGHRVRGPIISS